MLCRREDAHPGAQLRFTDHNGHRFQVLVTDQPDPNLAVLELRHRQRARIEDRIRAAKATGLRNLPFDLMRRNAVWLELVLVAQDLTCWTQALLLDARWPAEPKTLRYRLLHVAARVVRHARRTILRLQASCPGPSNSPRRSPGCEPCRCAAKAATNPRRGSAHPARGHAEVLTSRPPRPPPQPLPPRPATATAPDAASTTRTAATTTATTPHEKPRLTGRQRALSPPPRSKATWGTARGTAVPGVCREALYGVRPLCILTDPLTSAFAACFSPPSGTKRHRAGRRTLN